MADARLDPFGNPLPPGMFWREGVYYVKKMIRGIERKLSTRKRDYKSAMRRYHEIMKAWNDGESGWNGASMPTFAQYWLEHYRPAYTVRKTPLGRVDPKNPVYRDDLMVRSFLTMHGSKPLDAITKTMCQKWANVRRNDVYTRSEAPDAVRYPIKEATVAREINFLHAVFTKAIEDEYISRNPWAGIEVGSAVPMDRVLTHEEQPLLMAALTPQFQRWLIFMLGTGLRIGECIGIDPAKDVDFVKRFVRVTRKSRGLKKKVQEVPLIDPYLLDILQEQLTDKEQLWPQCQERLRAVLNGAIEKSGIPHLSPHSLRHTFATRYLQGGGDIYILSKILGHSSVRVTERVYAHLLSADLLSRSANVKLGLNPAAQPARVLPFVATKS